MAKCPKCGVKLHIWNVKAECPKCGVNIANYDWENRLEEDSVEAGIAFAKLHKTLKTFKYSLIGTKLRIARIPVSVIPLFSFLLPLAKIAVDIPFYKDEITLNAITIVLNILNLDIRAFFKYPGSEIIGEASTYFVAALALVVLSVLSLLVSLVFLLTNFKKLHSKGLFVTNLVASIMMFASSFCYGKFADLTAGSTFAGVFDGEPCWGVYVSAALFLLSAVFNLIVSLAPVDLGFIEEAYQAELAQVEMNSKETAEAEDETVTTKN